MDIVLDGRVAIVEAVEQDVDGSVKLAVVIEDDPGRDLGFARAHRSPLLLRSRRRRGARRARPGSSARAHLAGTGRPRRVLVAGIGNIFLGDDGFGVHLAQRLAADRCPTP